MLDHYGDGDWPTGSDVGGDVLELGEGLLVDAFDEDVDDPAARQADGEGVVVGHAVPLEHRYAGPEDLLPEVEHCSLHAAAGD